MHVKDAEGVKSRAVICMLTLCIYSVGLCLLLRMLKIVCLENDYT